MSRSSLRRHHAGLLLGVAVALFAAGLRGPVGAGADAPPGGLHLTPAHGKIDASPIATFTTEHACPADHRGSLTVVIPTPNHAAISVSGYQTPSDTPPTGTLENTVKGLGLPTGDYEIDVRCYNADATSFVIADSVPVHVDLEAGTWTTGNAEPAPTSTPTLRTTGPTLPSSTPTSSPATRVTRHAGSTRAPTAKVAAQDNAAGGFTLSVDPTAVALTVSGSAATGALSPITVDDERTNSPGWTVTGQAAAFAGTAGSIPATNLGWTPSIDGDAHGASTGSPVQPGDTGLSGPATLAGAPAGQGQGSTVLGGQLQLTIPTGTAAGDYSSTLTITTMTTAAS